MSLWDSVKTARVCRAGFDLLPTVFSLAQSRDSCTEKKFSLKIQLLMSRFCNLLLCRFVVAAKKYFFPLFTRLV